MIWKMVGKAAVALVLIGGLTYGGDALVLYVRKHQFGTVQINQFYVVAEKYNKYDYSIAPQTLERCVYALFPHAGATPCWYLERHQLRLIKIGS